MKMRLISLGLLGLVCANTAASPHGWPSDNSLDQPNPLLEPDGAFIFHQAKAVADRIPDHITSRVSRLRGIRGPPGQLSAAAAVARSKAHIASRPPLATAGDADVDKGNSDSGNHDAANDGFQNISAVGMGSTQYAVECSWDGTPLWLLLDTGSSDTWAVGHDFLCDADVRTGAQECLFGPARADDFSRERRLPALHFSLRYGSGEKVSGPMGLSDVVCGGVAAARQQVGLANRTTWEGNNVTAGILGLAYPAITSAYYGSIGDEALWNVVPYAPFLTTAVAQGSTSPSFSVALMKNSSEGVLAWGGLPPVDFHRGHSAVTDLIVAKLVGKAETAWKYSFYTIIVGGVRWDQTTDSTKFPCIVDTGTTFMYLPPPIAQEIAQAFVPEAVWLYQWGAYFVPCDAVSPLVSILIGGVEFLVNPADLVYHGLKDPLTGYCAVAVTSGGSGPYILGAAFLQSVVAVFDVGAAEMRFYGCYY